MWKTIDGNVLVISRERLARIISGQGPLRGQAGSLSSILGDSHLSRVYFDPANGKEYPVFSGSSYGRTYDIITLPSRGGAYSIISMRPTTKDYGPETEVARTVRALINWEKKVSLKDVLKEGGTGIYILEKHGKPIYVGVSLESFRNRWLKRLQVLEQMDIGTDLSAYILRLGSVSFTDTYLKPGERIKGLLAIEHALIRYLLKKGYRLTNRLSTKEFLVIDPGLSVTHAGVSRPEYLAEPIKAVAHTQYEVRSYTGPAV